MPAPAPKHKPTRKAVTPTPKSASKTSTQKKAPAKKPASNLESVHMSPSASPKCKAAAPRNDAAGEETSVESSMTDSKLNTDSVYFEPSKKAAIITKPKKKAKKRKETKEKTLTGEKTRKGKGSTSKTKSTTSTYASPATSSKGASTPRSNVKEVAKDTALIAMAEKWADKAMATGVHGLLKEYNKIRVETNAQPPQYSQFTKNQPLGRNRYEMIYCLDSTRVVLRNHPKGNDYIHANFVDTTEMKKRFICTQAPMRLTAFDFWWMAVQEKVDTIVMLGAFCEDDLEKCYRYFPQKGQQTIDGIEVTCLECEKLTDVDNASIVKRRLKVAMLEIVVFVKHYHWEDWPDFDVPPATLSSFQLLHRVRASKQPIMVHCSAGVGRTGTFVAVEILVGKFSKKEPCEDAIEVVKQLRKQRAWAVQKSLQYLFIHRVMLLYFTTKNLITTSPKLQKFIADYEKHRASEANG